MRDHEPARAVSRAARRAGRRRRRGLIAGAILAVALLAFGASYFFDFGDRIGPVEPALPDDGPVMPTIASMGGALNYSLPLGTPILIPPREDVTLSATLYLPADPRPGPLPASDWRIPLETAGLAVDAEPGASAAELDPEQAEGVLALDNAERRDIQRRLTIAGFDAGTPDGIFGPRTRSAIARWQGERGHPVTGFLDAEQLAALERETNDAARQSGGSSR